MNAMWAKRKDSGFTIVELLIVIVIIGILAAIVIVAYSGITARANDNKRAADLASLQKALELYYIDHGGYPTCSSSPGTNTSPYTLTANTVDYCLKDDLVPTYMGSVPTDPKNTGSYVYRYAAGYLKDGPVHYTGTPASDNYILGTKQDTVTSPVYSGWGAAYSDLTLLLGSSR